PSGTGAIPPFQRPSDNFRIVGSPTPSPGSATPSLGLSKNSLTPLLRHTRQRFRPATWATSPAQERAWPSARLSDWSGLLRWCVYSASCFERLSSQRTNSPREISDLSRHLNL